VLDFNETWIFLEKFSKNIYIPDLMKIRPVGAKLFHADGQKNVTKPAIALCNIANELIN